ncbi:hypothetical protein BLNAU_15372 [Blattamonas nauphoetae]|uniref:Uncharacterized protein n=1 Tax=Blattamonas nauphoetae TaxID=2049346 RepID=A0ABQ9XAZ4_9EUKA|nr:hypothetical protein BLNAU_15372 [Blattamonas nauphoetae]
MTYYPPSIQLSVTDSDTPLFMRSEPETIQTIAEAAKSFLSLVEFVKEGHDFDNRATTQACSLLQRLMPGHDGRFEANEILFDLVPKHDLSCCGFTESLILLLTSSNEELVKSSLRLLDGVVIGTSPVTLFDILQTGFFNHIPQAFYEQEIHLLPQPKMYLMRIVDWFVFFSHPLQTSRIIQTKQLSIDLFQQTFTGHFFRPIVPFLAFICTNRRRITDSGQSSSFPKLIVQILKFWPFLAETTQFVLSSPITLTFVDSLDFFETDNFTFVILRHVTSNTDAWENERPAIRTKKRHIQAKLVEEGLWDVIDIRMRIRGFVSIEHQHVCLGALLIDMFGGNVPFL